MLRDFWIFWVGFRNIYTFDLFPVFLVRFLFFWVSFQFSEKILNFQFVDLFPLYLGPFPLILGPFPIFSKSFKFSVCWSVSSFFWSVSSFFGSVSGFQKKFLILSFFFKNRKRTQKMRFHSTIPHLISDLQVRTLPLSWIWAILPQKVLFLSWSILSYLVLSCLSCYIFYCQLLQPVIFCSNIFYNVLSSFFPVLSRCFRLF